jgi:hypothetical protein
MANSQLLDVCAAIRSDLARQAQDLAAIRADCHAAADSVAPGVAALKDAISGLAGDGKAGRWISWGLSGVGAVQADSACLMLMLWALGKGRSVGPGRPSGEPGSQPAERPVLGRVPASHVARASGRRLPPALPLAGRLLRWCYGGTWCEGEPARAGCAGVFRGQELVLRFNPGMVRRRGAESAGCCPGGGHGVGVG